MNNLIICYILSVINIVSLIDKMNENPVKVPKKYVSMAKLLKNEKLDIIKTGFLNKRSKYLKMWKKSISF